MRSSLFRRKLLAHKVIVSGSFFQLAKAFHANHANLLLEFTVKDLLHFPGHKSRIEISLAYARSPTPHEIAINLYKVQKDRHSVWEE